MKREELIAHIVERYGVWPEYPWARWPGNAVFRHPGNRKWFGIAMSVPRSRLGLEGDGEADVLNVKVDPGDVSALRLHEGILPAYHMNKAHWISVMIEDGISDELLLDLLEVSYRLIS